MFWCSKEKNDDRVFLPENNEELTEENFEKSLVQVFDECDILNH